MIYQGKTGFNWFTGIVEDRNDPLFLNRVRVRIHGSHTHNKQLIATPDLPWSEVLMPTTSPSLSGLGTSTHGLVEGSTVMGFYRDYLEMQDAVVIGSFIGVPQSFYRINEKVDPGDGTRTFTKQPRTTKEGFNDPRLETAEDYNRPDISSIDMEKFASDLTIPSNPDGSSPAHINRNYGLTLALDKSPRRDGETKGEVYPKVGYHGTSDVNVLARDYDDKTYPIINVVEGEPKRDYVKPIYPFNHVNESESGHVLELDDTPDKERIHLYHRKGTRVEIDKDGNYIEKIVKDKYSVVLGDDTVTISGNVTVNITGDADITVGGKTNLTSTDDISMIAPKIRLNSPTFKEKVEAVVESLTGSDLDAGGLEESEELSGGYD